MGFRGGGNVKTLDISISSQQTGALFIRLIGLREVHFLAKLYGAACSRSTDIRTGYASTGLSC